MRLNCFGSWQSQGEELEGPEYFVEFSVDIDPYA